MREILGRRRRFTWPMRLLESMGRETLAKVTKVGRKQEREAYALRAAALTCAERWKWPVLPGVGHDRPPSDECPPSGERRRSGGRNGSAAPTAVVPEQFSPDPLTPDRFAAGLSISAPGTAADTERPTAAAGPTGAKEPTGKDRRAVTCGCRRPDCELPGAHPHDPGLLAATTDPRMVDWWWTRRPDAPLLLATGGTVSAVSLPAEAGLRALAALEDLGVRLGPVVATPSRCVMLVAPYSMEELGELLARQDWVPSSLRYHGPGGYVVLPPSCVGGGGVCWVREPRSGTDGGAPWLPEISVIVDMLVAAGTSAPDGSRLAY
jgi:Bifunctional DNA primase/polymerase, N-terminal